METKKYYWTMKDGNKIDIDDMTESQLKNVLKLLLKRNQDLVDRTVTLTENDCWRCFNRYD